MKAPVIACCPSATRIIKIMKFGYRSGLPLRQIYVKYQSMATNKRLKAKFLSRDHICRGEKEENVYVLYM